MFMTIIFSHHYRTIILGDIENIPVATLPPQNPYHIRTNTKDGEGKDLVINGQEEVVVNSEDIGSTLVIHKAGEHSYSSLKDNIRYENVPGSSWCSSLALRQISNI